MSKKRKINGAAGLRQVKPYPTYKDSGVEWLGEIPSQWNVKRLKYLAALDPESLTEDTDPTREMIYVDIGGVDNLGRILEKEQLIFATAPSRARKLVRDGDVIVSTVRTYLRSIASINKPDPGMVVSTGFAVVRPTDGLTSEYAGYALRTPYFVERVVANSKGVSFPAIAESEMATFDLTVPPETEQRTIAAFLDRETAKIDVLVAKKERVIELLQEKRSALITQAVTKGLDPKVPMKESGVEWLGRIPAHWGVKPLRWACHFQRGHDLPNEEREIGEVPVVSSSGSSATHSRAMAKAPGIVTGRYGTIGQFYLITEDYWPLNTTLYTINLFDNNPRFLWYMLSHLSPLFVLNSLKSAVPGVDRNDIHPVPTAIPPVVEQQTITAVLDLETAKINALISKVRDAIERLKEYRTALISSAVTGKIDVREEVG